MKTLRACMAVALTGLLMACTTQNANPSPTAVTPNPTATPTEQAQPLGTKNFGRYAAATENALYYASANSIWCYQNGSTVKLCDLPAEQMGEDLYVSSDGTFYFTARLVTPDDNGYDRVLYRLVLDGDNPTFEEHARSCGPMSVRDDTIHVLQSGEVICINALDGAQLSCANIGDLARLIAVETAGTDIYYNVYDELDNGFPYGPAQLVHLDMETHESDLIGMMYNAGSESMCSFNHSMVYTRTTSEDGENYLFTIVDSKSGSISAQYPMPKSIIDSQLSSETLYLVEQTPYMLITTQSSDTQVLTCYQLKEDASMQVWKTSLAQPLIKACYNDVFGCIVLLCEGEDSATFNLFTLDAQSGAQTQAQTNGFGSTDTQLRLCDVGATVLVFSQSSDDIPNPTLLYAASLDDLSTELISDTESAKE